jgi:hypothetical protein
LPETFEDVVQRSAAVTPLARAGQEENTPVHLRLFIDVWYGVVKFFPGELNDVWGI